MGKTTNKELFEKEIKRIERAIKRAEKQGYIFDEDILPKIPKRVTKKRLEEIKTIKPKYLKEVSARLDIETGEIVKPIQDTNTSKQKKKKSTVNKTNTQINNAKHTKARNTTDNKSHIDSKTIAPTITLLDKVKDYINSIPDYRLIGKPRTKVHFRDFTGEKNELISTLNDAIAEYENEADYEHYLQLNMERIAELINVISYDSDEDRVDNSLIELMTILKGSPLTDIERSIISDTSEMYGVDEVQ